MMINVLLMLAAALAIGQAIAGAWLLITMTADRRELARIEKVRYTRYVENRNFRNKRMEDERNA